MKGRGLPLIMGEFGAFRRAYPDLGDAAKAVERHVRQVMHLGFAGYIYWSYDLDEQPDLLERSLRQRRHSPRAGALA